MNDTRGFYKIEHDLIREDKAIRLVGAGAWAVYCVLKSFVNHESQLAFPSYSKLQLLTGMGRSTISKALDRLKDSGLIKVTSKGNKGGNNNTYKINERIGSKVLSNTKISKQNIPINNAPVTLADVESASLEDLFFIDKSNDLEILTAYSSLDEIKSYIEQLREDDNLDMVTRQTRRAVANKLKCKLAS